MGKRLNCSGVSPSSKVMGMMIYFPNLHGTTICDFKWRSPLCLNHTNAENNFSCFQRILQNNFRQSSGTSIKMSLCKYFHYYRIRGIVTGLLILSKRRPIGTSLGVSPNGGTKVDLSRALQRMHYYMNCSAHLQGVLYCNFWQPFSTSYTDSGLNPSTNYYYRIRGLVISRKTSVQNLYDYWSWSSIRCSGSGLNKNSIQDSNLFRVTQYSVYRSEADNGTFQSS